MKVREASVYVVDDDVSVREAIMGVVRAAGFDVTGFASAPEFLANPRRGSAGCLVLDVEMPELSGLDLQQRLNAASDTLPIIFVTGHADVPMSVTAIKAGAVDFLMKPFDSEALLDAIQRAVAQSEGLNQPGAVRPGARATGNEKAFDGIVGVSQPLQDVLRKVRTVAPTDTTVLIQGETGTGKEALARSLHDLSVRRNGRFVRVNCAAIPAGLLESELMGHEKGAFTGAVAQRIGRFELAQDGTIFLDEIGEMPIELQPKLLRILQEREFERLGGNRTVWSNARVVMATNRNLKAMVADRTFREDLYYRLSVFPITVPPLRARQEDIPILARHFVGELARRLGKRVENPSAEVLERLARHSWPGNIRELHNVLEHAVILVDGGKLDVLDLNLGPSDLDAVDPRVETTSPSGAASTTGAALPPHSEGLAEVSRAHILRVLHETNWVVAGPKGAAARLEIKRSTLTFRMKKLGIVRPRLRPSE